MSVKEFLSISGITKTYGVVKALSSVTFSVRKGEIHTILGENGAGKSTLVKIIKGRKNRTPARSPWTARQ
ncbi:ATP-binding cassette domain-containing protein [Colidextribacter sp. OB.20]|nr:ATP-binding cassette domain-containing protein [Colidextribacter sp. OB.20]